MHNMVPYMFGYSNAHVCARLISFDPGSIYSPIAVYIMCNYFVCEDFCIHPLQNHWHLVF